MLSCFQDKMRKDCQHGKHYYGEKYLFLWVQYSKINLVIQ